MKIRFAKKEDKNHVLNLIVELMNNGYKRQGKPLISPKDLPQDMFDKLLKRDDIKIFVAEENKNIVGLATLYIIPLLRRKKPRGELEELVVTKTLRRKGIGKKLLQTVIEYCKKHNIYSLKLSSLVELTNAHAFYIKQGGVMSEKRFRFDLDS